MILYKKPNTSDVKDHTLLQFMGFLTLLLFAYLWTAPFRDIFGLESRNALIAKEMLIDGFSLIPKALGKPYPDYPPLYFWLETLFSLPPGHVGTLSVVLPSVLSSVGVVALAFCLGRTISPRIGWLSAMILATFPEFWLKACSATIDMLLAFHVTAAITCLYFRERTKHLQGKILYTLGVPFFIILAFLTKGPIGIVIPAVAWGGYLLLKWRIKALFCFSFFIAVMGTLCAGGELAVVWKTGGMELVHDVVKMQVAGRIGQKANHPVYYYFSYLLTTGGIWLLVCAPLFVRFADKIRRGRWDSGFRQITFFNPLISITGVWFLGTLAIFTFASTRHSRYLLPLFPALAIMLATGVDRILDQGGPPHPRIWKHSLNVLTGIILVTGIAFTIFLSAYRFVPVIYVFIWLLSISAGWFILKKRTLNGHRLVGMLILLIAAGLSGANLMVLPILSRRASGRSFVEAAESRIGLTVPVVLYGINSDGDGIKYALYSKRNPSTLRFLYTPEKLKAVPRPCLLILRHKDKSECLEGLLSGEILEPVAEGAIRSKKLSAYLLRKGEQ